MSYEILIQPEPDETISSHDKGTLSTGPSRGAAACGEG